MADTKIIAKVKNYFQTEDVVKRRHIFNMKWAELIIANENSEIYSPTKSY